MLLAIFLLAACNNRTPWPGPWPELTATKPSPDGRYTVEIREMLEDTVDRRFKVILMNNATGSRKPVFISPDQGAPGTEIIHWSANSEWFLITGKNFGTVKEALRPGGQLIYLLYHVPEGEVFCNAAQIVDLPRFSTNDLSNAGFTDQF